METEEKAKKLYRSTTEKIIFGVCGGIAEYFNVDPTWIRLVFVFMALAGGSGFLIYLILALVMPKNPEEVNSEKTETLPRDAAELGKIDRRRNVIGLIIIIIGILAFFNKFVSISWIDWDFLWPVIIILIGVSIIAGIKPRG